VESGGQFFFLACVNFWCGKVSVDGMWLDLLDVHLPNEARIMGITANSRALKQPLAIR